jgi:GAF domain-containing protein
VTAPDDARPFEVHNLVDVVRQFAVSLVEPGDLPVLLHRLTEDARTVFPAAGSGILLEDRTGHLQFAAASEERIVGIERHQERIESGACWEAYASERIVAVDDLEDEERWPEYRARALRVGLRAVLGIPMQVYGRTLGVMNIYRSDVTTWTEEDVACGEILATLAIGYVVHADQQLSQQRLADNLQRAIDTRDVIGQAKGVLMRDRGIDADAAFALLRERSQHTNRKLRDVAQRIVDAVEDGKPGGVRSVRDGPPPPPGAT